MIDKPLAEKASDELVRYIIKNELQPGAKLPNEFELAALLGVGRSTVREAVKALVSRNVLAVRQGAGTFVADRAALGVSEDPLGFTFITDKSKLAQDLMEVRMALEPRIAALAATNATAEDVQQIAELADEVERLILADENHMEKDIEFHTKIAQSSGNLVVPNLLPIIQEAISLFVTTTKRSLRQETIDTHRAIVQAIAAKDAMGASESMTLHLIYNRDHLRKIFAEQAEQKTAEEK